MENSIYGSCKPGVEQTMQSLAALIESFNSEYKTRHGEPVYEHFLYRVKDEESMREKCRRDGLEETPYSALHEIHDSIGLRIVCNFVDEVYEIVEHLKKLPQLDIVSEKDYIKNVKPNGYRSYHMILTVETPYEDVTGSTPGHYFAEIQLRTIAMDTWAALEHRVKYKKDLTGVNLELITSELKRCADELASCDLSMQAIRNMIDSTSGGRQ